MKKLTSSQKNISAYLLKSFLTAYALTAVFHAPLQAAAYEDVLDYYISSIYDFLGIYDFKFILSMVLAMFFYTKLSHKHFSDTRFFGKAPVILSLFFSLCLLIGHSYYETGSFDYCFGSTLNFLKFMLAAIGYSLFFHGLILLLCDYFVSRDFTTPTEHFFTRHAFRRSFIIILASWSPFLLLSFPGNLCWDAIGQIDQVIGTGSYSAHHPLFHTLLMGGLTQLGQTFFHSYEIGLYIYVLIQATGLAAALAATIAILSGRRAKLPLLLCLLFIYCLTPVYSNMASTALKDVPYSAATVGYVICLALLLETPEKISDMKFDLGFCLLQLCVILFRNNGLYVILLSGIFVFCYLFKKYDFRLRVRCLLCGFAGSILAAVLILAVLTQVLGAAPGSAGEMLSLPFQQTARYLQLYREEISPEERDAIEAVLGDINDVAANYDPDSADPVKATFNRSAAPENLAAYLKAWFQGLLKHPASYAEAFFAHVYGWFDPAVSNSIRYEADYDRIPQKGMIPGVNKVLVFYYRFAGRFSPLAVFENIGAAVWALFFLTFYQKRTGKGNAAMAALPLWVSLLVCMASPCFYNHPRYAFPILFSIPFLYGFTLTGQWPAGRLKG